MIAQKHIVLLLVTIVLSILNCYAQQAETYSQYLFNQYAINPALGGTEECISIKTGRRQQWAGTAENPNTTFLTINKAVGNYKYGRLWHGVGVYMLKDETGPISYFGFYPSYSIHLKLSPGVTSAFGVFVGVREHSYLSNGIYSDPVLDQSKSILVLPDITPGFRIYSDNHYFGVSVKHVYKNKIQSGEESLLGSPSFMRPHLYAIWGSKHTPNKSPYTYYPSIMLKYAPLSAPTVDFNLMGFYRGAIGVGGSYRPGSTFGFLLKFKFLRLFSMGYSYDVSLNRLKSGSFNTHEIIIGLKPCKDPDYHLDFIPCPSY